MSYPVIRTRHFLQTCCNQCVRKTDTTVGGVRLLHDLTTEAFIQSDRLLPKDFFIKRNESSVYAEVNTQAIVQLQI